MGLRVTCNAGFNDLELLWARDCDFRILFKHLLHLSLEVHVLVRILHMSPLAVISVFKEEAAKGQDAIGLIHHVV